MAQTRSQVRRRSLFGEQRTESHSPTIPDKDNDNPLLISNKTTSDEPQNTSAEEPAQTSTTPIQHPRMWADVYYGERMKNFILIIMLALSLLLNVFTFVEKYGIRSTELYAQLEHTVWTIFWVLLVVGTLYYIKI
eukprot:gb/GECG01001925.1/.p1 GENE.gb/GECG01001925.1/~~gb/GECG01001925.1/.p1  ORF type:complete len:135 (+),score=9.46 gb/GECG01001925.1/:1-405(+)